MTGIKSRWNNLASPELGVGPRVGLEFDNSRDLAIAILERGTTLVSRASEVLQNLGV